MNTPTLDQVLQDARTLPPEDLQRLIETLSYPAEPQPAMSEEDFQAHLLEAGIIADLPTPLAKRQTSVFQPIPVQGKPLSETIIEERR